LERIEAISLWLSQARGPALYHEQEYGPADAHQASEDAHYLLGEVHQMLGLPT